MHLSRNASSVRRSAAVLSAIALLAGLAVSVAPGLRAAEGDPVGSLDSVSVRQGFTENPREFDHTTNHDVFGWAADPNDGSVEVHVYVDGRHVVTTTTGGEGNERPDVQGAHPWAPPDSGWATSVNWPSGSSSHTVCAFAINEGAGVNNTTLGCIAVRPGTSHPGDPMGRIDGISKGTGLIRVVGWIGDPDGMGFSRVHVYYDGIVRTVLFAGLERPDVHQAHPNLGSQTGFDYTLPIPPGLHQTCFFGVNEGRTGLRNTPLGCADLTIPGEPSPAAGDPRGNFDGFFGSRTGDGFQEIAAVGWAFDPDAADVSVQVRALAYNFRPLGPAEVELPTDENRPDVQAAHPGAPPDSGFFGSIVSTRGGGDLTITLACVWAPNVGQGTGVNRLIGCGDSLF